MTLSEARELAIRNSKNENCVQHVKAIISSANDEYYIDKADFFVSDWDDSANGVILESYLNGERL